MLPVPHGVGATVHRTNLTYYAKFSEPTFSCLDAFLLLLDGAEVVLERHCEDVSAIVERLEDAVERMNERVRKHRVEAVEYDSTEHIIPLLASVHRNQPINLTTAGRSGTNDSEHERQPAKTSIVSVILRSFVTLLLRHNF